MDLSKNILRCIIIGGELHQSKQKSHAIAFFMLVDL